MKPEGVQTSLLKNWVLLEGRDIPRRTKKEPSRRWGPKEGELVLLFQGDIATNQTEIPPEAQPWLYTYPNTEEDSESQIKVIWLGKGGTYCVQEYTVRCQADRYKVLRILPPIGWENWKEPYDNIWNLHALLSSIHLPGLGAASNDGGHGYGCGGRDW